MGTVSVPVLVKKSFPVRALEIGPRGPADSGRPSLSAPCGLTGPGVPCPQHLLASSGPVSPAVLRSLGTLLPSRLTCFPSCGDSFWLPWHHFTLFSSHRTRLVERIPRLSALFPKESVIAPFLWGSTGTQATRPTKTVAPCGWDDLPTTAGGLWTWKAGTGESSCGHTLGHHRVRGSVWVVVVVAAVFPKTCAVALVFQRRLLEKNGSFPGSPQKDFEKSRGRDVIDLSSTLTCG